MTYVSLWSSRIRIRWFCLDPDPILTPGSKTFSWFFGSFEKRGNWGWLLQNMAFPQLENYDIPTNQHTNFRVHWEVTLPIKVGSGSGSSWQKLDPDPVCYKRFDPDPQPWSRLKLYAKKSRALIKRWKRDMPLLVHLILDCMIKIWGFFTETRKIEAFLESDLKTKCLPPLPF